MEFKEQYDSYRRHLEQNIVSMLPSSQTRPSRIHEAMYYSMTSGGKRLRPVLVLACHDWLNGKENATAAAVAIECIHTYSLVHDDLPCLDNSDLRRGRATCHKAFDEATALLTGDALLTYAFQLLAQHYKETPHLLSKLLIILSNASGSEQLIGGQMEDILCETEPCDAERLAFIHQNKTAALITTSIQMGFAFADANDEITPQAQILGHHIGLGFQIVDDILDATSDSMTLGKPVAQDEQNHKATYVSIFGLEAAKEAVHTHTEKANSICDSIGGKNSFMKQLISSLEKRVS